MNEHPILFNTEMVKAILDGRKTMTRRVIKPQPINPRYVGGVFADGSVGFINNEHGRSIVCPYGQPGDRLWVRETWGCPSWMPSMQKLKEAHEGGAHLIYKATPHEKWKPVGIFEGKTWAESWLWRPSIHMPRWASRINLEVTGVRVERVQDISAEDIVREGIESTGTLHWYFAETKRRENFIIFWNKINAKRGHSWESNPWVWVVEFKRAG